jgi:hypothetical protein
MLAGVLITYRGGNRAGFSPASLFGAGTARLLSMKLVATSTRKPGNPVGGAALRQGQIRVVVFVTRVRGRWLRDGERDDERARTRTR